MSVVADTDTINLWQILIPRFNFIFKIVMQVTEDQCITSEGIHKVELLLPFMNDASADG